MEDSTQVPAKKDEIVKWAYERFYEGGFHATGIDTAMANSGISKRTLYKHFSSKEDLIEAVLERYGAGIADALFRPAMEASSNPRLQILAFFEIRKGLMEEQPLRGCLGMKASQEYVGKHQGIFDKGRNVSKFIEAKFAELCGQAGFAEASVLGGQLNLLFQGAMLLSQVYGESSPFDAAKATASLLLKEA